MKVKAPYETIMETKEINPVESYLIEHFSKNPGFEANNPFKMEIDCYRMYGVDNHYSYDSQGNKTGITRFQGVVLMTLGKGDKVRFITPEIGATIPLDLFPYISHYKSSFLYEEIGYVCFTIWFKEPITKEIWDALPKSK